MCRFRLIFVWPSERIELCVIFVPAIWTNIVRISRADLQNLSTVCKIIALTVGQWMKHKRCMVMLYYAHKMDNVETVAASLASMFINKITSFCLPLLHKAKVYDTFPMTTINFRQHILYNGQKR